MSEARVAVFGSTYFYDPVATARGSVTTPSGFSADESFSCIEELQTSCGVRRSARCFASLARV